jgi:cation diffusion facilitator family transporter
MAARPGVKQRAASRAPAQDRKAALLRRGERLEAISVLYNAVEGMIVVVAGLGAGSAALLGFGGDSLIEVTSAALLWWRLRSARRGSTARQEEQTEHRASRWAGGLLMLLAAGIVVEAGRQLVLKKEPAASALGMLVTGLSLMVMPFLAWEKLKLSKALNSPALRADAHEQVACAWLSGTTLAGLSLNAALGWWWADPGAALCMVPWIAREGWTAWRSGEPGAESR